MFMRLSSWSQVYVGRVGPVAAEIVTMLMEDDARIVRWFISAPLLAVFLLVLLLNAVYAIANIRARTGHRPSLIFCVPAFTGLSALMLMPVPGRQWFVWVPIVADPLFWMGLWMLWRRVGRNA